MNRLQDFAEVMKAALAEKKAAQEVAEAAQLAEACAIAKKKEKRKKKIRDGAKNFIDQLEGKAPVPLPTIESKPVIDEHKIVGFFESFAKISKPEPSIVEADIEPAIIHEDAVSTDLISTVSNMFEAKDEKSIEQVDASPITIKRLQDDLINLRRYIDAKVNSIDTGWQGGGGGAARIADLDDVDVRTIPVAESDILMYDPIKRKWLPKTLASLAEDLGPLIGGKLYTPYNRMIDVVGNKTYIGEAHPGVSVNQTGWRIKMIEELPTGDLQIIWASGSDTFNLVWDDRLTYTYDVT